MRKVLISLLGLAVATINFVRVMSPPSNVDKLQLEQLSSSYKNHPADVISAVQVSALKCLPNSSSKRSEVFLAKTFTDFLTHAVELSQRDGLPPIGSNERQKILDDDKVQYSKLAVTKIASEISSWSKAEQDEVQRLMTILNEKRREMTKCVVVGANNDLVKLKL
jgi:hypothetical protein